MDLHLQTLLRRYLLTKDPQDAVIFTNTFARSVGDPNTTSNAFYEAWWWLHDHPAFYRQYRGSWPQEEGFFANLDMTVQKVNPLTGSIDDNKALNTQVEIWLENGPWELVENPEFDIYGTGEMASHDIDLDCGGLSCEEAILEMAKLVRQKYGDYEPSS